MIYFSVAMQSENIVVNMTQSKVSFERKDFGCELLQKFWPNSSAHCF